MAGKIKFVKRGGSVSGIIPNTDLAAHEDGSNYPDPLDTSRAQDLELPLELSVLYINPDADYQQGVQISKRQTSSGVSTLSVSLPIVFSDTKAKQVADVLHYLSWIERTVYKLELSRKWSKLEPTDVIQVEYNDTTFLMRIVSKNESASGIISLECVAEDSSVYTQSGLGASSSPSVTQVIKVPVQTVIYLLDLPALRTEDDNPGIYVAAAGLRPGWTGCTLFKSSDNGTTYTETISLTEEAILGNATTVLGNYWGGNTVDELNTVTIKMLSGSLSSIDNPTMLNGGNFALLGNELIHFRSAELIATNTYKLSGLLRGRRGTERGQNTHSIGERFILINTLTWYRLPLELGDIGIQRLFKAVSFNTSVSQTASVPFTPAGVALECLPPVHVGAGRSASEDIIISFIRRDRLDPSWRDFVDTYMSETSESYEIDIYDDSFTTVIRTLTSSTTSVTYSAANQVTDFGVKKTSLNIKVYQLSSAVGRGFPATHSLYIPRIPVLSSQWRVYATERVDGRALTISEVGLRGVVGGPSIAVGGLATASASSGSSVAANAFDGNTGTIWQSGWDTLPQWIQYTFPTAVSLAEVAITPYYSGTDAPKTWKLQYYTGSVWEDYYIKTNDTSWTAGVPKLYTL